MRSTSDSIFFQMPSLVMLLFLLSPEAGGQMLLCDKQDQSSLLQLKHELVFDSSVSTKLVTWNSSPSDCCGWDGVTCGADDGHVIALHLYHESISGGIHDSNSPLFDLHHLQLLDLSENNFSGTEIPSGIGKLLNLVHLHLSHSGFGGRQVPAEISSLTSLLTLDLSYLQLQKQKLSRLVHNLSRLTELNLDGVNMSGEGEWGHALSSTVPRLQVLSLRNCSLSGPSHSSLVNLHSLTELDLSYNNLSSQVPGFLANLTCLRLAYCGLYGKLPHDTSRMANLQVLDLSYNDMLSGTLPEFTGNMTHLFLRECRFSGSITNTHWRNLKNLAYLDLSGNTLSGTIPMSLFSLPLLGRLNLRGNQFSGQIGEFPRSSALQFLFLTSNKLEGPIPSSIFNLEGLVALYLSNNNFSGTIDLGNIFQNLGNLTQIDLSFNSLSITEDVASTNNSPLPPQLGIIRLASCNLKAFPSLLRNHSMLFWLDLSDSDIVGEVPTWIWKPNLKYLNLSHNSLINFQGSLLNLTSLTPLQYLDLNSNMLQGRIPLAKLTVSNGNYLPNLEFLSVSNNNYHDSIPLSLCNISSNNRFVIDFSNNYLTGRIPPCLTAMNIGVLNLKRNNLNGNIPDTFQDQCSFQTFV